MEILVATAIGFMTAAGVYLTLRKRTFAVVLGMTLLRQEGRRAVLSVEGHQLLAQVRPLLEGFSALEARANAL